MVKHRASSIARQATALFAASKPSLAKSSASPAPSQSSFSQQAAVDSLLRENSPDAFNLSRSLIHNDPKHPAFAAVDSAEKAWKARTRQRSSRPDLPADLRASAGPTLPPASQTTPPFPDKIEDK